MSILTAGLNFAFAEVFFAAGASSKRTSGLKAFFFAEAASFAGTVFLAETTLTGAAFFTGADFFTGAEAFFGDAETGAVFFAGAAFADFALPDTPLTCLLEAADFAFFSAGGTAIRFCFASLFIEKKTPKICFPALSCYIDIETVFDFEIRNSFSASVCHGDNPLV
ncbi:MAG: hypothetical protein IKC53_11285 [Lentisphaeria bacterium]|nr:hypothetical protein [Lentisphaeria bacterium]